MKRTLWLFFILISSFSWHLNATETESTSSGNFRMLDNQMTEKDNLAEKDSQTGGQTNPEEDQDEEYKIIQKRVRNPITGQMETVFEKVPLNETSLSPDRALEVYNTEAKTFQNAVGAEQMVKDEVGMIRDMITPNAPEAGVDVISGANPFEAPVVNEGFNLGNSSLTPSSSSAPNNSFSWGAQPTGTAGVSPPASAGSISTGGGSWTPASPSVGTGGMGSAPVMSGNSIPSLGQTPVAQAGSSYAPTGGSGGYTPSSYAPPSSTASSSSSPSNNTWNPTSSSQIANSNTVVPRFNPNNQTTTPNLANNNNNNSNNGSGGSGSSGSSTSSSSRSSNSNNSDNSNLSANPNSTTVASDNASTTEPSSPDTSSGYTSSTPSTSSSSSSNSYTSTTSSSYSTPSYASSSRGNNSTSAPAPSWTSSSELASGTLVPNYANRQTSAPSSWNSNNRSGGNGGGRGGSSGGGGGTNSSNRTSSNSSSMVASASPAGWYNAQNNASSQQQQSNASQNSPSLVSEGSVTWRVVPGRDVIVQSPDGTDFKVTVIGAESTPINVVSAKPVTITDGNNAPVRASSDRSIRASGKGGAPIILSSAGDNVLRIRNMSTDNAPVTLAIEANDPSRSVVAIQDLKNQESNMVGVEVASDMKIFGTVRQRKPERALQTGNTLAVGGISALGLVAAAALLFWLKRKGVIKKGPVYDALEGIRRIGFRAHYAKAYATAPVRRNV